MEKSIAACKQTFPSSPPRPSTDSSTLCRQSRKNDQSSEMAVISCVRQHKVHGSWSRKSRSDKLHKVRVIRFVLFLLIFRHIPQRASLHLVRTNNSFSSKVTMSQSNASLLSRHRLLSPTASVRVSPLCLGAMTFGEAQKERYGECSKETAFEIMDEFYNAGGNFIDTANTYQNGESEQWVGEWMRERNVRDEIVIATKYSASSPKNIEKGKRIMSNYQGNGTKSMKMSLEHSLKNLGSNYVDLFYVHWWDYSV